MALSAFALMLVVAAYECRSVTRSIFTRETFDNVKMNWTALVEVAFAVMVTQMDLFNRLLDTVPLTAAQFGLSVAAALLLLGLWEAGKALAQRRAEEAAAAAPPVADRPRVAQPA